MKVEVNTVAGERGGRADPRRRAGAGWRAHHIVGEPRWWRHTALSTWICESAHERRPFPSTMKGMHHLVSPLSYFFRECVWNLMFGCMHGLVFRSSPYRALHFDPFNSDFGIIVAHDVFVKIPIPTIDMYLCSNGVISLSNL
jgi:hypothetical protein